MGGDVAQEAEAVLITYAGEYVPVIVNASAAQGARGQTLSVVRLVRAVDLTRRLTPEAETNGLRIIAKAGFLRLLDISPDAVLILDEGQRILYFNRSAEQIFGYSAGEVPGQPLDLLLPPRFSESHRRHVSNFAAAPEASRYMDKRPEIVGRRKDGTEFPAETSFSKLTEAGHTFFIASLRDITERKRADEISALARSRQEALTRSETALAEQRQRLKELSALNATAALLSQSLQMEDVLGRILDKVVQITGMEAAEVSLLEQVGGRLVVRARRGFSPEWLAEEANHPVDCLCRWVAQQDEPLCLADAPNDSRVTRPACVREGLRAYWGIPLQAEGRVLGVMSLHSRAVRPATLQDRDLLTAIASQIGVALTNIRLYQEVQRLSVTDELTGLRNRRALEERLHEEAQRAERYRRPLSVIMADIDHFKDYNDAHGHPEGDAILQQVAGLIQAHVRETDFVARYGGEEFTVLLPETARASGLEAAEKIRSAVEAQRFRRAESQPDGRLTISLGVAAFPGDGAESRELIHKADQALYAAKRAGRNQVSGA